MTGRVVRASCPRNSFGVQPNHPSAFCEAVLIRRLPPVVEFVESAAITRCRRCFFRQFVCLLVWFAIFNAATTAVAGGGPENLLLVVNSNSESSKTIANAYIELRKIPPMNVLYLDWKGSLESASGVNFRDKILTPVVKALDDRHLAQQIDYVVYSSDFPWRVDLQPLFPDEKLPTPFEPLASITGATYLLRLV